MNILGGQEENKQTFTKISRVAEQTVKNVNKKGTKNIWLLCIFNKLVPFKNHFAFPTLLKVLFHFRFVEVYLSKTIAPHLRG